MRQISPEFPGKNHGKQELGILEKVNRKSFGRRAEKYRQIFWNQDNTLSIPEYHVLVAETPQPDEQHFHC